MTKFDLYFPRIMGAAFLAAMLFGGCASERQNEGIDRFGNARSVQISCQDGAGKTVFETNVDNFGCGGCTGHDRSTIINEGRCVQIAHPDGNIIFCGYACSVVPLKK